jgi:hypothetical protein
VYDLKGILVLCLEGQHVIDTATQSIAIAFRSLLEGNPSSSVAASLASPASLFLEADLKKSPARVLGSTAGQASALGLSESSAL